MMKEHLATGVMAVRRKPGLVVLVWALQALVAFIVVWPLAGAFAELQTSGFDRMLAETADITILAELRDELLDALSTSALHLLWAIPLAAVIRTVTAVGIINAVRDGGLRSFWDGVGRFGGRAIAIAVVYLALAVVVHLAVLALFALTSGLGGEKVGMLVALLALPTAGLVLSALMDCMQDYSQIGLVTRGKQITTAIGHGFTYPFRHPRALLLYGFWMLIAIAATLAPIVADNLMTAATRGGIIALLIVQQLILLVRAGVTIAWYGSEVDYFEANATEEEPLIA